MFHYVSSLSFLKKWIAPSASYHEAPTVLENKQRSGDSSSPFQIVLSTRLP